MPASALVEPIELEATTVRVARREGVAIVTLDSPPVNALSAPLRHALREAITRAARDPAVGAIVLIGAGRGFSGGADILEFGKPPRAPGLRDLIETIDACTKPVVAALHGMTLGGGLELAMGCHARVAVPSARMGLPEVKLGLIPGAGGTQRLPRLVGPEAALRMITSGTPIDAATALADGLIDEIVASHDLESAAIAHARRLVGTPPRRVRDAASPGVPGGDVIEAFRTANARKFRGFEAPVAGIAAIQAAVDLTFDAGLARERELFATLLAGPQSAALRHLFFAERKAARIDQAIGQDIDKDIEPLPIAKVGIIGAGTMGGGIAMTVLNAGLRVTIIETGAEALDRSLTAIRRAYEASAKTGRLSAAEVATRLDQLDGALDLQTLADCDLVIEAVFEQMAVKTDVFAALDRIAKPGAILASNTSYLDIDTIAAATSRPDHVLGLHFFSPAHIMRLLEIVRGARTAPQVIATAQQLAKRLSKVAVVVGNAHGFVGNRMLAVRQREANALILEGAAPWDVDRVLVAFGLPMGPFAMADLAGLDLGWTPATSSGATVRDILCERGRRGQKTRCGFYDYDEARKATPTREVDDIIRDIARRQGIVRREVSDADILERCLYPMINEGAKILDEKIARRASDIDVIWVNGYGWPAYRGGPMYYADSIGLDHLRARLAAFQATRGDAFAPSPLLERLVAVRQTFGDLDR